MFDGQHVSSCTITATSDQPKYHRNCELNTLDKNVMECLIQKFNVDKLFKQGSVTAGDENNSDPEKN
jgi:hypothetical protein